MLSPSAAAAARLLPLLAGRAAAGANHQAAAALLHARYATSGHSDAGSGSGQGASGRAVVGLSLAAAAALGASQLPAALADAAPQTEPPPNPYARPAASGRLPQGIVLYQYEVCPFCCKVKAMLDYYKLPYETVEVNPLTKAELKWSDYRKVPVVKMDGGRVAKDSSAIMSELTAELEAAGRGGGDGAKRGGGWRGGGGGGGGAAAADEERWRRWVDERFVRVLTANIYRSWDETWNTFSYIAGQSHWNWASQQAVRLGGSLIMWRVGKGMPGKYGIEGDLRAALYSDVDSFVAALGGREYLGGSAPNLADLSMFGVLRAVAGTPTYNDIVINTKIGPWLARMTMAVGDSSEVKPAPAK
ncbi:prostaglandin E synthase-like [Raphidocelis subcapitata]|uniref:Prostaglandin E synthase 2 n=1 Tax=Raphidocelis subcapitata TaxID=307507 RepID=A0A2V0NLS4_9CHLO|nr:prostaglandin E synthase-like [Raphidocelis subcapitata]|eukprot:GBF88381.1 prostaglandin E synthase-like [Raphidocelis subcapitata]